MNKVLIEPIVLVEQKTNIAIILATFAFTMMGFLAAVITIFFSFAKSRTFKKFSREGRFGVFFTTYYYCIISLALTMCFALVTLGKGTSIWAMQTALITTVNSLFQICLITFTIINLSKRAMKE
ncbi:hypothetical protein QWY97_10565 [Vibrio cortegadensis]|uniref:hypothetical protein n=1 Tax=Vibrio cortegadensis TaxID=1328770 RepID=UPI0021C42D6E|nr:hypothetical protein [Vibrio cortegadensis]MDN3697788.1 hypothetical protein [Vibrio cortegadensis]